MRFLRSMGLAARAGVITASLVTCGGDPTGPTVDHVVVTGRPVLRVGESVPFVAQVFDAAQQPLTTLPVTWSSSNAAVAKVDDEGTVTALDTGRATVRATAGGTGGEIALTITLRPVTRIDVTPAVDSLLVGDSIQLSGVLRDSAGLVLAGRAMQWRTSDSAKATVTAGGLLRARAPGSFAVTLSSDGVQGGAYVTAQERVASLLLPDTAVVATDQQLNVIPLLRSAAGNPLTGRPVAWSIANPAIATVSVNGVVTPVGLGLTQLTATCCGGLRDSGTVRVVEAPLSALLIIVPSGTFAVVGESLLLNVNLQGASSGQPHVVTWISRDTTLLRASTDPANPQRGRLVGLAPGRVWVLATSGGRRDSALLDVVPPVARLVIAPETVVVRAGSFTTIHPTLQDSAGRVLNEPYPLSWTVADLLIAASDNSTSPAHIVGFAPGRTTAIGVVTYRGRQYRDTVSVVVIPATGPRLSWNVRSTFAAAHTPLTLTVSFTDSSGGTAVVPQNVTLESGDTSVVAVVPMALPALVGGAVVTLQPRRAGAATVIARADSLMAPVWVQVIDVPVRTVSISVPALIRAGDSAGIPVTTLDGQGVARPYPLTWYSSDSAVAVVTPGHVLRAYQPGRVRLRLASGTVEDTATVTVTTGTGPVLMSVQPSVLVAGATGAVLGTGFDLVAANNVVTIDGVTATVLAATAGRLDVQVPAASSYPCASTHSAAISVTTPAGAGALMVPVSTAGRRSLATGDTLRLAGAAARCIELGVGGGVYQVAITGPARRADSVVAFEVRGSAGSVTATPPAEGVMAPARASVATLPGELEQLRAGLGPHLRALEASRSYAGRLGAPAPMLAGRPRIQAGVGESVNGLVRFRVPGVDRPDFCVSHVSVTARRAYRGQRLDIYEDISGPLAGQMDATYDSLGREFDTTMYPLITATFGDPLAMDHLLDANGRVVLLVSPAVSALGTAFVVSCDFYPDAVAPSSNMGEVIYLFAAGSLAPTAPAWHRLARSILMHESKHVAALAQRLSRGAALEESWLEEGTAVIAEELWARGVYGTSWRGNASYASTLYCDVRPSIPQCNGRPFAMFNAFALLYDFADGFAAPPGNETLSPLGPVDGFDGSFYGSAWSLLRWTLDQHASSEAQFLTALTQDPARTGVANLEARAGRSLASLVSDWMVGSVKDDASGLPGLGTRFAQPSWNTPDIFAGMRNDFPASFPQPFPYRARTVSFGAFRIPIVALRGGSAAVLQIQGTQTAGQLLQLVGLGNDPVPAGLSVLIVRGQ